MARWLDDLIGKIFAIDGVDQVQVGRLDFKPGTGVTYDATVVAGEDGDPTTLELTINSGAGAGSSLKTLVDSGLAATIERINFIGGEGVTLEGTVDPTSPATLHLTVNTGPSGSTVTSSVESGDTGTANDYIPGGDADLWDAASIWEYGPGSLQVTGLAAPSGTAPHFRAIQLDDVAGGILTLVDESASSAEANRFATPNGESSIRIDRGTWGLWYDNTISRWRILGMMSGGSAGELYTQSVNVGTDQDNWAPGGASDWDRTQVLRINSTAACTISGFAAPLFKSSPHVKWIFKTSTSSSFAVTLEHEEASSSAANRMSAERGADSVMADLNEMRQITYDTVAQRWRLSGDVPQRSTFLAVSDTGTKQDWVPGGDAAAWDACTILGVAVSSADLTIGGLAAPLSPKSPHVKHLVRTNSTGNVILSNEDALSVAGNRISITASSDTADAGSKGWVLLYGGGRWRPLAGGGLT